MGVCCEASDIGDDSQLRDLAAPDITNVQDKYQRWEYKLPFCRTAFYAFKQAVNEADKKDEGYVTLAALAETLSTPAWAGLTDPSSSLGEFLLSDAFKNGKKGLSYDQIDVDYLILFGMLHCRDKTKPERKAVGFYEVLQDGGL